MLGRIGLMDFLVAGQRIADHYPYPRFHLDPKSWRAFEDRLSSCDWILMTEWAHDDHIHAMFQDEQSGEIAVVSHHCINQRFIALGKRRPGAARIERSIHDLHGLTPMGLPDIRPWLDHGQWLCRHPMTSATPRPPDLPPYAFLPVEGDGLHQVPVGPVHAGIIEPGHFRFHAQGETVVRLEERLGYLHRGLPALLTDVPMPLAAKRVSRVSGDSTVAYGFAFARAVEAACQSPAPPRAQWIRGLMAELERIANHLFDIGAICNDAAFAMMLSHMGALREKILRTNHLCFGHRLLMDCIQPGGIRQDLTTGGQRALQKLLSELRHGFDLGMQLYDHTPSMIDRTTGCGVVRGALAHRFGAGGVVGRASSRAHDSRKLPGYPPYDGLEFSVPILPDGDVHSRLMLRALEIRESLSMIDQILSLLPDGPIHTPIDMRDGEGLATCESFRGEVIVWVRLTADGVVKFCHAHDPSWFQWPLIESAIEGNIIADFPLINKSFNCSYAGVDL